MSRALSRRTLLRRGAVAGASLVLASALAACGDDEDTSSSAPAGEPAASSAPAASAAPASSTAPDASAAATTAAEASTTAPSSTAAAELSGEIKFLNLPGWMGKDTIAKFEELHPDVKITEVAEDYTTSSGPAGQVAQNPDAFDMIFLDAAGIGQLEAGGFVKNINPANISNYNTIIESARNAYPWGMPTDTGQIGIGYRKDKITEPVTSWADFWKLVPKYSGKVVLIDFDRDAIGNALIYLGYDGNSTNPDEVEQAKQALLDLKPHVQAFKVLEISKTLLDGSAYLTMGYDFETAAAMNEDPNIAWVAPSEGLIAYVEGWTAVSTTDHMDVIEAFMDFNLEPANYAALLEATGTPGVVEGTNTNPITQIQPNAQFIKFLGADGVKLWSAAWNEIKSA